MATNSDSDRLILSILNPSPAFSWISASVLPSEKPPSLIKREASKTRFSFFSALGVLSGSMFGAISHKNIIPKNPAINAGITKSNNWMASSPISLAIPTTSKFVDVPMVVAMPPMIVAIPIGIRTLEELIFAFSLTAISAGINITTIGVLLINALKNAPNKSTPRREIFG